MGHTKQGETSCGYIIDLQSSSSLTRLSHYLLCLMSDENRERRKRIKERMLESKQSTRVIEERSKLKSKWKIWRKEDCGIVRRTLQKSLSYRWYSYSFLPQLKLSERRHRGFANWLIHWLIEVKTKRTRTEDTEEKQEIGCQELILTTVTCSNAIF